MLLSGRAFRDDDAGLETVEYIILGAILVMVLALAFVAIFNTIQTKLIAINNNL